MRRLRFKTYVKQFIRRLSSPLGTYIERITCEGSGSLVLNFISNNENAIFSV